jgi:transposase
LQTTYTRGGTACSVDSAEAQSADPPRRAQLKAVREIAWRAQLRLAHRYRRMNARKLHQNKICVAIARELAGFVWDVARQVKVTA